MKLCDFLFYWIVKANVYVCVIRAGIDLLTGQPWEAL